MLDTQTSPAFGYNLPVGPPAPLLASRVEGAGRTDVGVRRKQNQDAFLLRPKLGVFAVADGMGGAPAGDVAAAMVLARVHAAFLAESTARAAGSASGPRTSATLMVDAIQRANLSILAKGRRSPCMRGMGTTFAGVVVDGGRVTIAHVGDSRVYRLRGRTLAPLTTDHTVVSELGEAGWSREMLVRSGFSGMLTRAVGTGDALTVDVWSCDAFPGDTFLVSSDGLHEVVGADGIRSILLRHADLAQACDALIKEANLCGGPDNVTAVLVRFLA
jgi:protein phosphatase